MHSLTASHITLVHNEPRVRDTMLADRLGFAVPHQIRELIQRNAGELSAFGILSPKKINTGKRGRPAAEYWLNEQQALVVCMLSRAPFAPLVRRQVIEVFTAWREGKMVHVNEHHRRPPRANAAPVPLTLANLRWFDVDESGEARLELRMPAEAGFAFVLGLPR